MSDPAGSSGDLIADRRFAYARALESGGDHAAAADLIEQCLERAPLWPAGWFALGQARLRAGDADQARSAFERCLEIDPADHLGAAVALRLGWKAAADRPAISQAFVAGLFDRYANRFDGHLLHELGYVGPALLRQAVEAARPDSAELHPSMLDLGCGTGLGGLAFADFAGHLVGFDLSGAMLAKAAARTTPDERPLYARLAKGDVVDLMRAEPAGRYHLVVAADVLVYIGELAPVFEQAHRVLAAGGLFAFSAQASTGDRFALGEDVRYAHSRPYLTELAGRSGFAVASLAAQSIRRDRGAEVPGWIAVLIKSG